MCSKKPDTPEFWRDYASSALGDGSRSPAFSGEIWDRAARDYDDLEACHDYMQQVECVLASLRACGAVAPEKTVLDIACGTGAYALRMAPFCRSVTALDISSAMLQRLEKKRRGLGIVNIQMVTADWRDYTPAERFDLVFVSLTPLLRSLNEIDRMLDASRRFFAIVSWAGVKKNVLHEEIAREVLGSAPERHRVDVMIPFNYLYARGYAPDLRFFHGCWERTRPWQRQAENLLWQMEMRRPLTDAEKGAVQEAVRTRAVDGMITVRTQVRTAFLLVDKEAGTGPC